MSRIAASRGSNGDRHIATASSTDPIRTPPMNIAMSTAPGIPKSLLASTPVAPGRSFSSIRQYAPSSIPSTVARPVSPMTMQPPPVHASRRDERRVSATSAATAPMSSGTDTSQSDVVIPVAVTCEAQ
ncbi:hypothetical protein ABZ671_19935 [Micromonospora sp. NPDC006766]|uniref:hypothetical protein n=1 Tax=Micromonospora sp. NPDC006766 TaxID=3154778 RepID=UPI0033C11D06